MEPITTYTPIGKTHLNSLPARENQKLSELTQTFVPTLPETPSIENLDDKYQTPADPKLKTLHLKHEPFDSTEKLICYLSRFTSLESLTFEKISIDGETIITPSQWTQILEQCPNLQSLESLTVIIGRHSFNRVNVSCIKWPFFKNLKHLHLEEIELDVNGLANIHQAAPHLESLSIKESLFDDRGLEKLKPNENLKTLKISSIRNISVKELLKLTPKLEELSWSILSERDCSFDWPSLPNLNKLTLSNPCQSFDEYTPEKHEAFHTILFNALKSVSSTLSQLMLEAQKSINLEKLTTPLPNLTKLSISSSDKLGFKRIKVDTLFFQKLNESCFNLKELNFNKTVIKFEETDELPKIKNLKKLSLVDVNLPASFHSAKSHYVPQVFHLINAVSLHLEELKIKTSGWLNYVDKLENLPNLKALHISNTSQLDTYFGHFIQKCPKIESLTFAGCIDTSGEGFYPRIETLKELKLISGGPKLSPKGFHSLLAMAPKALKIELKRIRIQSGPMIPCAFDQLESIRFYYIDLSNEEINTLLSHNALNLQSIEVEQCTQFKGDLNWSLFPKLKKANLFVTAITSSEVQQIKSQLPKTCTLQYTYNLESTAEEIVSLTKV